jgi:hypothetical protein
MSSKNIFCFAAAVFLVGLALVSPACPEGNPPDSLLGGSICIDKGSAPQRAIARGLCDEAGDAGGYQHSFLWVISGLSPDKLPALVRIDLSAGGCAPSDDANFTLFRCCGTPGVDTTDCAGL